MPDLILGTATPTDQPIGITGGMGISLPSASLTDAGLMSKDDKVKVYEILTSTGIKNATIGSNSEITMANGGTYITRNVADGNVALVVGQNASSTGYPQIWQKGPSMIAAISIGGYFTGPGIQSITGTNNSLITTSATGTVISRNVADTNAALMVNQASASSTGLIQSWQKAGSTVAFINRLGGGTFKALAVNATNSNPNFLFDIDAGTSAAATTLGSFKQNTGTITVENGTTTANQFAPVIRSKAFGRTDASMNLIAQGSDSYTSGAFTLSAMDAAGTGSVTSGNTFQLLNNATPQLTVDYTGVVTIPILAGTGLRIAAADNVGSLTTVNNVPVANGGTGLSSAGTNGQILVSNGSAFVLTTPTEVTSGSYSPTITGSAGSYTGQGFRYSRIGDIVHVSGMILIVGGLVGQDSFKVSIPIPSDFTNDYDASGVVSGKYVGAPNTNADLGNYIYADTAADGVYVYYFSVDTSNLVCVEFTYIIQ